MIIFNDMGETACLIPLFLKYKKDEAAKVNLRLHKYTCVTVDILKPAKFL